MAAERRKELKDLREKLMAGTREAVIDQFDDILNASGRKIKKTKVDVRSENAKKFRELFDRGEVPEGGNALGNITAGAERSILEKEQELQQMRKTKREQKEFFRKMEAGELNKADEEQQKEPKLLVGKIRDVNNGQGGDDLNQEMPELASLSNRFSYFEHFEEKKEKEEENRKKSRHHRRDHLDEEECEGGPEDEDEAAAGAGGQPRRPRLTERDMARKECKARSVLNKFKEMESRVLNGEEEGEEQ